MASSQGGYGICGHKNTFSSKVKEGNYAEDGVGAIFAPTRVGAKFTETTDHRRNFRNPREVPVKEMGPASAKEAVGRGGINATVLFNHGPNWLINDKVRWSDAGPGVLAKRDAMLKAEAFKVSTPTSESRAASAAHPPPNFAVKVPDGPVALPNFARRSTFTYTSARQQA